MKRTGPESIDHSESISDRVTKRRRGIANDSISVISSDFDILPDEMLRLVFSHFGLSFEQMTAMRLVSKHWKSQLDQMCRQFISTHHPHYDPIHFAKQNDKEETRDQDEAKKYRDDLFHHNPVRLIYEEYIYYKKYFCHLSANGIYAALAGNLDLLNSIEDNILKAQLMSIALANDHKVNFDTLEASIAEHLPRNALVLAAGNGNFNFIKKYPYSYVDVDIIMAFERAAGRGHLKLVQFLDEHFTCLKPGDIRRSAFIEAVKNGHLQIVQYLIAQTAGLNVLSLEIANAVRIAADAGQLAIVQYFCSKYGFKDELFRSLNTALTKGHYKIVEFLYQHIKTSQLRWPSYGDSVFGSAFLCAIAYNHRKAVEYILSEHPHHLLPIQNAVEIAIIDGCNDILKLLLPLCHKERISNSVIRQSAMRGHGQTIRLLSGCKGVNLSVVADAIITLNIKFNVDIPFPSLKSVFSLDCVDLINEVIAQNNLSLLKRLTDKINLNNIYIYKEALFAAIESDKPDCLAFLLRKFDVYIEQGEAYMKNGKPLSLTLLDFAVSKNSFKVVKELLIRYQWPEANMENALRLAQQNKFYVMADLLEHYMPFSYYQLVTQNVSRGLQFAFSTIGQAISTTFNGLVEGSDTMEIEETSSNRPG